MPSQFNVTDVISRASKFTLYNAIPCPLLYAGPYVAVFPTGADDSPVIPLKELPHTTIVDVGESGVCAALLK
jgi:hypothetical protein